MASLMSYIFYQSYVLNNKHYHLFLQLLYLSLFQEQLTMLRYRGFVFLIYQSLGRCFFYSFLIVLVVFVFEGFLRLLLHVFAHLLIVHAVLFLLLLHLFFDQICILHHILHILEVLLLINLYIILIFC